MIFPIGDTNVKGGYKPLFSYGLIAINIVIFLFQVMTPGNLVCEFATIPGDVMDGNNLFTLFTSMFLHGGWMHLIGNMMFLWIFADNIEAIVGNKRFIIFYLLGGLFSAGVHIFFELYTGGSVTDNCCMPCTQGMDCANIAQMCTGYIPSLGASGAISAVMGAYLVMFPKSKIKMLFFVMTFEISAIYFLGLWFAEQLISGVGSIGMFAGTSGGVAWWAHIGGFVFGLAFGYLCKNQMKEVLRPYQR